MRTPHPIETHPAETPPYTNPYDELGALDDGPLEEFLHEEHDDHDDYEDREDSDETGEDWAPPNHRRGARTRRRRNRFAGLPLALKAVIGLVVLAAFLTLADRWALLYAEHAAADKLKDQLDLSAAPEVEIGGFPFLTQLAGSRVDTVKVTVPDVAADRVSLAKVSATATGIRIEGGPTSIRGATIPQLQGEVLLSFADLNRELGASQVTFTGHGTDEVRARGTLPVAGQNLRLRADARIQRDGERGISTEIDGMRLDIGNLATYRPGSRPSEGLHLTPTSAERLAKETKKAKALLSVPAIVQRLGVPQSAVQEALRDDTKLAELTGSADFAREAMNLNLIDAAVDNPALLKRLGFDPALLDGLTQLTRPVLVDRLSLGFRLPKPADGDVRLQDVRVQKDGIRVRVTGEGLSVGG
ncbi:DUF2993 domain-containing protein [Streptomyces sp. NPDC048825]|uniref:LmeA family phospholipid-binding protein n=1 Tax=Streptomyces sp. NPDC048825 TaxID=3365592 RepID=UPI003718768C